MKVFWWAKCGWRETETGLLLLAVEVGKQKGGREHNEPVGLAKTNRYGLVDTHDEKGYRERKQQYVY